MGREREVSVWLANDEFLYLVFFVLELLYLP